MNAVLKLALYSSESILHENLDPFMTAECHLIAFFDTEVSGIIAPSVIPVALHVVCRNLAYISEDICATCKGIITHRTLLNEESGEKIQFLLQLPVILNREM